MTLRSVLQFFLCFLLSSVLLKADALFTQGSGNYKKGPCPKKLQAQEVNTHTVAPTYVVTDEVCPKRVLPLHDQGSVCEDLLRMILFFSFFCVVFLCLPCHTYTHWNKY